jgi:hypothetical protein
MSKRQPDIEPDFESIELAEERPRKRALCIQTLPDYEANGRSGLRDVGETLATLHGEQIANADAVVKTLIRTGAVRYEYREDGRPVDVKVKVFKPDVEVVTPTQSGMTEQPRADRHSRRRASRRVIIHERAAAGGISTTERELYERIMQEKEKHSEELQREREKNFQTQLDQIREQIARKDSERDNERTEPQSFDGKSLLYGALAKRLEKTDDESTLDRVIDTLAGRDEEGGGFWSEAFGFAKGVFSEGLKNPMGALSLAAAVKQGLGGAQPQMRPQPQATPSPTPQPQQTAQAPTAAIEAAPTFESEINEATSKMLDDMSRGASVRASARRFNRVIKAYPEQGVMVEQSLQQPAEAVLQFMAMQIPQPEVQELLSKPESVEWMRALQAELKRQRERDASAQTVAQNNGNGSHVETTAAMQ